VVACDRKAADTHNEQNSCVLTIDLMEHSAVVAAIAVLKHTDHVDDFVKV